MAKLRTLLSALGAAALSLGAGYLLGPSLGLSPAVPIAAAPIRELVTSELRPLAPKPVPAPAPPTGDPSNPDANLERAWLLSEGPVRDRESGRRIVTLTFDDGPGPVSTPALLRELDRHGAKATFFLIGEYLVGDTQRAQQVRAAARSIAEKGHGVGSHSLDHHLLTILPKVEVTRQIEEAHERITAATGVSPSFFRPPYGGLDAFGSSLVVKHDYALVLWSVEAQDMVRDDEDGVFEDIRRQLEYAEGGIVLLHDIKMQTVRVTARLLDYLGKRRFDPQRPHHVGFEIVDLPTYLAETQSRPQPYKTRAELAQARMASWRKLHPPATTLPGS